MLRLLEVGVGEQEEHLAELQRNRETARGEEDYSEGTKATGCGGARSEGGRPWGEEDHTHREEGHRVRKTSSEGGRPWCEEEHGARKTTLALCLMLNKR